MNHKLTWKLEKTDLKEYEKTKEFFHCTDIQTFFTLSDVWNFLGFRLKKERCGYSGIKNNFLYTVTRI